MAGIKPRSGSRMQSGFQVPVVPGSHDGVGGMQAAGELELHRGRNQEEACAVFLALGRAESEGGGAGADMPVRLWRCLLCRSIHHVILVKCYPALALM